MEIHVTTTNQPLNEADFAKLTRDVPRFHPGIYPQWNRIVARGLRQTCFTIEARDASGEILGALPLVLQKSLLFGKHLISVPYVNLSGLLVPEGENRAAIDAALVDEAVKLADRFDVKYLELRGDRELEHPKLEFTRRSKVLMRLELPETADELWKAIGPKVRNQIRKGEKSGLQFEWGGRRLLKPFYDVFAETMRNVGTPVYSRKLFTAMFDELGEDKLEICVVRMPNGRVASAALLAHGRGITEVPTAGTLRFANTYCANMFMYWQLLKHSIEDRHAVAFDFGRSSVDSNTWRFKKQWGATENPAIWKYYVRHGSIDDVRPDNASYKLKIWVWKRLPVWVTKLIGPPVVRGIP